MKVYSQLIASQFENLAADPATTALGYVYYNTTINKFKLYNGTSWVIQSGDAEVAQLTNKDIDGGTASNSNRITLPKDTVANLTSLTRKEATIVYGTDTAKAYIDNGSSLIAVGSGGGGGAKSYAVDDDSTADGALGSNWGTFDDSAYPPVDGAGGTVTATLARTTSSPLQGAGSILFTPGGQYDASKFSFTIDRADFARMFAIKFDYEIGTYASYTDGDVKLAVICASDSGFTTDLQVIQPAGHSILKVAGQETHVATFQTHVSNLYYRVCLVQTTAATGYTLKLDNFSVGPQSVAYGCPVTDWQSYTLTVQGSTSNPTFGSTISDNAARWRRVGDTMEISYVFKQTSGVGSAAGSGEYRFPLPSGYSIDTTKLGLTPSGSDRPTVGSALVYSSNVGNYLAGTVQVSNTSQVIMVVGDSASNPSVVGSGFVNSTATILVYTFNAKVPIQGFSSNVLMSDSADTRVVAARIGNLTYLPTTTVGNNNAALDNASTLKWGSAAAVLDDTHGCFNYATGMYTIKVPGRYEIIASCGFASSGAAVGNYLAFTVRKNATAGSGTIIGNAGTRVQGVTSEYDLNVNAIDTFVAGDTISLGVAASNTNYSIGGNSVFVSIKMLSGPAQIAASEKVEVHYKKVTTTVDATRRKQVFETKVKDSHGIYSNGTITIPRAGPYIVCAQIDISYTSSVALSDYDMQLRVNGSATPVVSCFDRSDVASTTAGMKCSQINTILSFNAGDTLEIYYGTDAAGGGRYSDQSNFFSILGL